MRIFVSKEGDTGPANQVRLSEGATGADLLRAAGSGISASHTSFDYDGDAYTRSEFQNVSLEDGKLVSVAGTKATNGR